MFYIIHENVKVQNHVLKNKIISYVFYCLVRKMVKFKPLGKNRLCFYCLVREMVSF